MIEPQTPPSGAFGGGLDVSVSCDEKDGLFLWLLIELDLLL